jgi:hypothetical protein
MTVTAEQVKEAMEAAGIDRVDHHACSLCGFMTCFIVLEPDVLVFDHGCWCSTQGPAMPRRTDWEEPANWINSQSEEWQKKLMKKFGFKEV